MTDADGPVVLYTPSRSLLRLVGAGASVVFVGLGVYFWIILPDARWVAVVMPLVCLTVTAFLFVRTANARLVITRSSVTVHSQLRRPTVIDRADIVGVAWGSYRAGSVGESVLSSIGGGSGSLDAVQLQLRGGRTQVLDMFTAPRGSGSGQRHVARVAAALALPISPGGNPG